MRVDGARREEQRARRSRRCAGPRRAAAARRARAPSAARGCSRVAARGPARQAAHAAAAQPARDDRGGSRRAELVQRRVRPRSSPRHRRARARAPPRTGTRARPRSAASAGTARQLQRPGLGHGGQVAHPRARRGSARSRAGRRPTPPRARVRARGRALVASSTAAASPVEPRGLRRSGGRRRHALELGARRGDARPPRRAARRPRDRRDARRPARPRRAPRMRGSGELRGSPMAIAAASTRLLDAALLEPDAARDSRSSCRRQRSKSGSLAELQPGAQEAIRQGVVAVAPGRPGHVRPRAQDVHLEPGLDRELEAALDRAAAPGPSASACHRAQRVERVQAHAVVAERARRGATARCAQARRAGSVLDVHVDGRRLA